MQIDLVSRGRDAVKAGALTIVGLAVLLAGCGPGMSERSELAGQAVPPKPAPPLRLRDYQGRTVDLRSMRGDAVLVAFLYTHCPDVCPLITSNLRAAVKQLGPAARRLRIVAVSVDPRGDTPGAVTRFLRAHRMTGRMDWLIGSGPALRRTWARWGIAARTSKSDPERIEHSADIFGIDARGLIKVVYPTSFEPQQIVSDVPTLAGLDGGG